MAVRSNPITAETQIAAHSVCKLARENGKRSADIVRATGSASTSADPSWSYVEHKLARAITDGIPSAVALVHALIVDGAP